MKVWKIRVKQIDPKCRHKDGSYVESVPYPSIHTTEHGKLFYSENLVHKNYDKAQECINDGELELEIVEYDLVEKGVLK